MPRPPYPGEIAKAKAREGLVSRSMRDPRASWYIKFRLTKLTVLPFFILESPQHRINLESIISEALSIPEALRMKLISDWTIRWSSGPYPKVALDVVLTCPTGSPTWRRLLGNKLLTQIIKLENSLQDHYVRS